MVQDLWVMWAAQGTLYQGHITAGLCYSFCGAYLFHVMKSKWIQRKWTTVRFKKKKDTRIVFLPLCPCCPKAQLSAAGCLGCLYPGSMLGSAVWGGLAGPAIFSIIFSSSLLFGSAPFLQTASQVVSQTLPAGAHIWVQRSGKDQ